MGECSSCRRWPASFRLGTETPTLTHTGNWCRTPGSLHAKALPSAAMFPLSGTNTRGEQSLSVAPGMVKVPQVGSEFL